ncbi:MAG: S49 family peptidase, partial [Myxococcales bacterium]|nr:S49 family peptidase [Myxococcales bacterium]
ALQSVRPKAGSGLADHNMAVLSLGYAPDPSMGVGTGLRILSSGDPRFREAALLDLGFAWRPAPFLAFTFVGRDLNAPFDIATRRGAGLPASFLLGTAIRPGGVDWVTFDVSSTLDTEGAIGLRGTVLSVVPYLGRVFGTGELRDVDQDPVYQVTGGLSVDWGRAGIGGGVVGGENQGTLDGFGMAHLSGAAHTGLPEPKYIADFTLSNGDARGILALLARLDAARSDNRVAGVLIRVRGSGIGTAYAEEIREAISLIRATGRPVVCHLDSASHAEFFACAAATHTYFDPAGGARLLGHASDTLLYGEALHRLGVRTEFVRIGEYKSAAEQFTSSRNTEPAREQREALYDDVQDLIARELAKDFRTTPDRIRALIDGGPYLASELRDRHLIRGDADALAMDDELASAFGGPFPLRDRKPATMPHAWGTPSRVGVVVVDGDLVDGDNIDIPIVGIHCSGGQTIARTLDRYAHDPSIAAIVLRIDSPGGSVLASDQIWRAVRRARARKPVIASMGSVAASGGYYIASAADEIWAD